MIHPEAAIAIQREVASTFGDPVGVRDMDALVRALGRPFATKNGIPSYPTFFNRVSVLFQGMIDGRPFLGANRRTAVTVMAYLLESRGYRLTATKADIDLLLLGVEAGYSSWHRVTVWIKKHSVRHSLSERKERP